MSKLFELSKNDFVQSFLISIFTSVAISFLTALYSALAAVIEILKSGSFAIDFNGILISLLTALSIGVATGIASFVGSILKKLNTDQDGTTSLGSIKIKN